MKQRFSSLDIKVIAHELSKSLTSLRVVNVYDLSSRIFLIKFARPNHRQQLVIDSGFRCHLTSFARTTAAAPTAFVARLRKFLRTRRVTSISQVGTDRILEFQFSEGQYRLFFEFYAGGNIVLTDKELKVIALLRTVSDGAEYEHLQFGSSYNLSERQNINGIPQLSVQRVKEGLQKYVDKQASGQQGQKRRNKVKAGDELRKALASSINEFPPLLLDHALRVTGFDASLLPVEVLGDEGLVRGVLKALEEADRVITDIMGKDTVKGYIFAKSNISSTKLETEASNVLDPDNSIREGLLYNDFHPFRPKQFEDDSTVSIVEFEGFNRTVDEFFSSIEGQKLESRLQEREDHAKKKLENARQDQAKRLGALQTIQEINIRKAQAIEANLERVEEATAAINGLIAQGKDWIQIEKLIEIEQKRQNPVAEIIKIPLKLHENTATLLLGEWDIDIDEDESGNVTDSEPSASDDEDDAIESRTAANSADKELKSVEKRLLVDVDLALSGWANAREYYDHKKTAAAKEEKTLLSSTKALKSQTHKIESDLKRALKQEKAILRPVRTPLWFEKFIYFISSDGYLVIGGKDAQQSDILYKRHLRKGDIYVHADLNGAASVIIKNNPATPDAPVPPSTLSQAGNMSVVTSSAWDSKAVMSAWWVSANQVSKIASTGDYLDAGQFEIQGQKNFLPPAQLLLGFAVMFQISEQSKARHSRHRFPDGAAQTHLSVQAGHDCIEDSLSDDSADTLSEGDDDIEDASEGPGDGEDFQADYKNPLQTGDISQSGDEHESEDLINKDEKTIANGIEQERPATSTTQNVAVKDTCSLVKQPPEMQHSPEWSIHETSDEESHVEQHSQTKHKSPIPVRGKRGKKKKIAAKYADQDDEDRAEAMRLLGSKTGQEKAEENAKAHKVRQEEAELQKQRRREQHQRAQKEGKQQEELRRAAQEESGDMDDDNDEEAIAVDLETLIGTPLPGDSILEALPVCAPWNALGKYKYKAKIQPGSQKKGKAIREILGRWGIDGANPKFVDKKSEDIERIWPRETELIKGWKDTEIFNVMPVGKVRVMMSGAAGGTGGGGSLGKGKARGGKGSKKAR